MARDPLSTFFARLRPPPGLGGDAATAAELLRRWAEARDPAALELVVWRHGALVLGTCRRVCRREADAEDAFQATFLMLARSAGQVRASLPGWLHRAAHRAALRASRRRREVPLATDVPAPASAPADADELAQLDAAVNALGERHRRVVVLCYLQGHTAEAAAAALGVPVGTVHSRLSTARGRLAASLTRRGVALPATLTLTPLTFDRVSACVAATLDPRTAAPAVAIAHGVLAMVRLKTAVLALTLVGVAATGTGVSLMPHAGGQAPPPAPTPEKAAPVPQQPPEPAWMTTFRKAYELKEGEYVKRVAPPYPEERKEYMYRVWYKDKQTPEKEAAAREHLDKEKLFLALFLDFDGRQLTRRIARSSTAYLHDPELERAGKTMNVWDVVTNVTGRLSPEIVIDPESSDHPLLSVKLRHANGVGVHGTPSVIGDFITRKDAPLDKLVPQLEKILRDECELDVRLTLKREEHPVYVVSGAFKPNPPAWRPRGQLDVYATEAGLNKEYDFYNSDGTIKDNKSATVDSNQHWGTPTDFLRSIGLRLQTRIVWDTPLPSKPRMSWINHTLRNPTEEQAADDRDPDMVLAHVSAQTGLVFKKKVRTVEVLYLSAPEPK